MRKKLADEIMIRDPYVMSYNGKYYLYGTRSETCWGEAYGFDCYVSKDLKEFEGPYEIFKRPEGFFATSNYWAPECYEYKGVFYLVTTFGGNDMKKGIYIMKSSRPTGPFELYSERLTPKEYACIDGTLYFEKDKIYLIYSRSFEDTPDADICYQELNETLDKSISQPQKIFAAKEAPWAKPVPFAEKEFGIKGDVYFSDGPYLIKIAGERLYMIWSGWSKGSYAVGVAMSDNGLIDGKWTQVKEPLWGKNGGHGMIFKGPGDNYYFCLHYPNDKSKERPHFVKIDFSDDNITIAQDINMEVNI